MKHITDNQDEVFDIVDEQDRVIGKTTRREANTNKNLIHRSIYVAVFNTKGEIFMQQRSATKDTDPLKWTISCTGHVSSGDTYERAAKRELKEELGVDLSLEYIDTFLVRFPKETEMTAFYKAYSDGPFVLHPEEIQRGKFLGRNVLLVMIKRKAIVLALTGKIALRKLGWM